jgi:methylenetetrahydrofolate reductase (NADPH)
MRAAEAEAVIAGLRRPRYEVLPLDGIADSVAEHVPRDVTVVHVGVPGRLDAARLLRISSRIGVGESARFARRHASYQPGLLVEGLASSLADPADGVGGFHFYTFNEVARTERWRQRALARLVASV